jgi:hypothetical protein
MPSRNRCQAALLITWKKVAAARVFVILFFGFGALLGCLWIEDSFSLSFRTFLFFFPYLFLFLSQDMFRDEIDSGALENVVFIQGWFREYLLSKNLILAAFGLAASLSVFLVFGACGLALRQIAPVHLVQFLIGVLAGLYYLMVGGHLSFFFKSGSNVLIVIIGQVFLGIGFFLSMTERRAWVEALVSGSCHDLVSRLRLLGLAVLFPNVIIVRRLPLLTLGLVLAGLGAFCLEWRRIKKLELFRR